jgi:hypothetical protein
MAPVSFAIVFALWILQGSPVHQHDGALRCVSFAAASTGLERVAKRDWRSLDRARIETVWPGIPVSVPTQDTGGGLEAVIDGLRRSCEVCDLTGGAAMDEKGIGLRSVDLWACPRPEAELRAALQGLTRTVVGPTASPTSTFRTEERSTTMYSWLSRGDRFTLQADAIASDGGWLGQFRLARCREEDVKETWRIAADRIVHVLRTDVEKDQAPALRFTYRTTCLGQDRACRARELDGMWTTLRDVAERRRASRIRIEAEDCFGSSLSFVVEREQDGRWHGGLWNPAPD